MECDGIIYMMSKVLEVDAIKSNFTYDRWWLTGDESNIPSSSPASCAPPMRNTLLPAFLTGSSKGVKHSWPAHITIVSTCGMNISQ
jgi:hypothetical protein